MPRPGRRWKHLKQKQRWQEEQPSRWNSSLRHHTHRGTRLMPAGRRKCRLSQPPAGECSQCTAHTGRERPTSQTQQTSAHTARNPTGTVSKAQAHGWKGLTSRGRRASHVAALVQDGAGCRGARWRGARRRGARPLRLALHGRRRRRPARALLAARRERRLARIPPHGEAGRPLLRLRRRILRRARRELLVRQVVAELRPHLRSIRLHAPHSRQLRGRVLDAPRLEHHALRAVADGCRGQGSGAVKAPPPQLRASCGHAGGDALCTDAHATIPSTGWRHPNAAASSASLLTLHARRPLLLVQLQLPPLQLLALAHLIRQRARRLQVTPA